MRKDIIIGSGIFVIGVGAYMLFRHLKRKKELMEAIDYLDGFLAKQDAGKNNIINKQSMLCVYNHKLTNKNKAYKFYTERAKAYKEGIDTIIVGDRSMNVTTLKDGYGKRWCKGLKKDKYITADYNIEGDKCTHSENYGEDCKKLYTNYKKK